MQADFMRVMGRRTLVVLPLLLLASWCRPAAAEGGPPLDALLARLAAVPERRAEFREQRRFGAIDGVLESSGHLVFRRGHLEKVTTWPQPERLEVDGDRLVLTQGNDPPRVIDMASVPELRVLIDAIRGPLLGDAAALRAAFTATTAGTMAGWTLDLVPRDPAAAKLLRSVRLEGHDDRPTRLSLTQANGDEQTMTMQ